MDSRKILTTGLLCLLSCFLRAENPEKERPVPFGDPFILLYEGVYYAYGTAEPDGIGVYVSEDLKNWRRPEKGNRRLVLSREDVWGDRWFWAPEVYLYDARRANVLGEYGGIGMVVKDHIWESDRNWGYVKFNTTDEVTAEYVRYADRLLDLVKKGFSAGVYTQTTDVEVEVNGLMTYDRKIIKIDENRVRQVNREICNSLNKE